MSQDLEAAPARLDRLDLRERLERRARQDPAARAEAPDPEETAENPEKAENPDPRAHQDSLYATYIYLNFPFLEFIQISNVIANSFALRQKFTVACE